MQAFELKFSEVIYSDNMISYFSSKEEVENYFMQFRAYYDKFMKNPAFKKRMQCKYVKDYEQLHAHSVELQNHYSNLLLIGKRGFSTWLNDLVNK